LLRPVDASAMGCACIFCFFVTGCAKADICIHAKPHDRAQAR
jgi:hypothetical protein